MKSSTYIRDLSLEELERISLDESIPVPSSLNKDMEKSLSSLSEEGAPEPLMLGRDSKVRRLRVLTSIAASVVIVLGLSLGYMLAPSSPKDTYDDPALAYAEVEKALLLMGETMGRGMSTTRSSAEMFTKGCDMIATPVMPEER